jgi:hypothetical protein
MEVLWCSADNRISVRFEIQVATKNEKKFGLEMNSVRGRTSPGPSESMPVHLKKSDQATVAADGRPNPQPPLAPLRGDGAGRRRS